MSAPAGEGRTYSAPIAVHTWWQREIGQRLLDAGFEIKMSEWQIPAERVAQYAGICHLVGAFRRSDPIVNIGAP